MALTSPDRRRIMLASALTLVALPALWWANQSDTGAPNVATAGIAVADQSSTNEPNAADMGDIGDVAPVFLDGPSGQVGAGLSEIAVPAAPQIARITTTATFRSTLGSPSACMVPGISNGQQVTVVNLDNNRSVTCTAILGPVGLGVPARPGVGALRRDRRPHRRTDPRRDPSVTHSRPAIRELLESAALAPRRDLGQNFVADPNTVRRIATLARVGPGDRVVEIGAGLGSLTLALADTGATVTAIEIDRGVVPILRDVVADRENVTVVEGDAMQLDWSSVLADDSPGQPGWVLVANLPYNVATPLICDLLDDVPAIERMIVMVQREAAERFAATPRTSAYGAVSVKAAYWGTAKIVGHVPASVFVPRPNVESALVEITTARATGDRPGCPLRARSDRVRATPQDAAPLAGRHRRTGDVRGRGHQPDGATGGTRRRRLVPAHRRPPRGRRHPRLGHARLGHTRLGHPRVTSPRWERPTQHRCRSRPTPS